MDGGEVCGVVTLRLADRWRAAAKGADQSGSVAGSLRRFCSVALFGSVCLGAAPAVAIDGTWTGATNSDWNTDTNWSPGPTPNNTASFANNGAPTNVSIANLTSINTIQFVAGAPAYSFTFALSINQSFNVTGTGIVNNSSNAPSFGSGAIFFKNGSTAGNAIFTTGVEFDDHSNAGTAVISNTVGSGSGLDFTGTSTAAGATITTSNTGSVTGFFNSSSGGSASITTNSGGRTLFADFSTAGNANIVTNNGGRTDFSTQSTGALASFVNNAGGIVDFSGAFGPHNQFSTGSISGAGNYFFGRDVVTTGGNNLSTTVSGVIADGGFGGGAGASLIKVGAGTLTLSGINTYSGGTTVNAGTLQLSGAGTLGSTGGTTAVSGGILDLGTTTQTQAALNQSGGTVQNGTINVATYQLTGGGLAAGTTVSATTSFDMQAGTVNGLLGGTGSLSKTTAGTVTLSGANTYIGGTTINAGTLEASHVTAGAIDALGTGNVVLNGGTLRSTVSGQFANTMSFASGATSTFSAATGQAVTTTGFFDFL